MFITSSRRGKRGNSSFGASMTWAGNKCEIPALFVEPGSSEEKVSPDTGDTTQSLEAEDELVLAKMEFILGDEEKGADGQEVSK